MSESTPRTVLYEDLLRRVASGVRNSKLYAADHPLVARNMAGLISVLAPLARTLIGKRVGDTVTAQLPAGKKTFDILEVNFPWTE